jgi:hypothetical protein
MIAALALELRLTLARALAGLLGVLGAERPARGDTANAMASAITPRKLRGLANFRDCTRLPRGATAHNV